MIKNIPNKYTQKMLLTTIDEKFRGTYDFFYLPIDFKNKCNVGYAFINMVRPEHIVPLVQKLDRKKWEKFNSEKVCNISYARIQVRSAAVGASQAHKQVCVQAAGFIAAYSSPLCCSVVHKYCGLKQHKQVWPCHVSWRVQHLSMCLSTMLQAILCMSMLIMRIALLPDNVFSGQCIRHR